jgi:hypothetical protein
MWTPEEIAKRSTDQIKTIRENAARKNRDDIVAMCDVELANRQPARPRKQSALPADAARRRGQYVAQFHFVCPKETGITQGTDGLTWTGTWVVAEGHAIDAQKYGSLVALHTSRAEPSYLQGEIRGWRKSPRQKEYAEGRAAKTPFGIDFQFVPNDKPVAWQGDAAAERGYLWVDTPNPTP